MFIDEVATDPVGYLEWVKQLGGWAVVVWVVAYFMRESKADRASHMDELNKVVDAFKEAIDTFKTFEQNETGTHKEIIGKLDKLIRIKDAS